MPDINKIRKELDEKNAEMGGEERERIDEEYKRLSEQETPTEEKPKKKIEEKKEKDEKRKEKKLEEKEGPEKEKGERGKETEDFSNADEVKRFLDNVMQTKKPYSETFLIKENGTFDKIRADGKPTYLGILVNSPNELYQIAKETEERYPEYHFVFKTGPEGQQIKYTVSKKVAFKEKKGGSKEKKGEKEGLEQEITERFYDELKKIKSMPDETGELKKEKTEKYFQLIENWQDLAYLDNYKGIQNSFSELDKLKPSIFLYNLKKAQLVNKVGLTMALNYKEWDIEDKEKLKIIKKFVNKQSKEKNIFYSKDKTFKEIAQILASKDIPFKGNVDVIVENIKNPDIKAETIAEIVDIEKETIEEKKQLLQEIKEKMVKEKIPSKEKIKEQLKEMDASEKIMKIFENPESLSQLFTEGSEILKNPEVQKKIQELKNTIEKVTKEKGKIPESVTKAAESIKGEKKEGEKESPWKTAFGTIGWSILLFLVLFMLAELKGIDYLSGQSVGKKKEKK